MHQWARKRFTNTGILIINLPDVWKASTFQDKSSAGLDYLVPIPRVCLRSLVSQLELALTRSLQVSMSTEYYPESLKKTTARCGYGYLY